MPDGVKARRYVSPRREEQARETRRQIVAAAHRLFVGGGYAATRVDDVAREAGVAVQTIYSAVGNKRDLLWAVLETAVAGDDESTTVEQQFRAALAGSSDRDERLHRAVAFGRRLMERSLDAHRIMRSAAASDATIATALEDLEDRRRRDTSALVDLIAGDAGFRDDGSRATAQDAFYAVASYEVYEHLVRTCGWPADRYERWMTQLLLPLFER